MSSTNSLEPSPSAGLPTRADHWESSFIGRLLWRHRWQLLMASLAGAVLLAAGSYLIPPTFTGRTTFLPPQQSSSPAISALASLGALAGAGPQVRNSGDQYLAFLQSVSIRDRLVDRFDLMRVYDENLRVDTRVTLSDNTRLSLGRKDGLLSIEVDDKDPQRAADLANAYVEELQQLTDKLTLTEAQQRRAFFEGQMKQVRQRLSEAQQQLQATGISANAIKAEPKATADGYAKLRAELTSAKIRLAAMRRSLADDTPEVQRQLVAVSTLSRDLQGLEEQDDDAPANGYVAAYFSTDAWVDFKIWGYVFPLVFIVARRTVTGPWNSSSSARGSMSKSARCARSWCTGRCAAARISTSSAGCLRSKKPGPSCKNHLRPRSGGASSPRCFSVRNSRISGR